MEYGPRFTSRFMCTDNGTTLSEARQQVLPTGPMPRQPQAVARTGRVFSNKDLTKSQPKLCIWVDQFNG